MEPVCRENDKMVSRFIKYAAQIKRGNIVVFSDGARPEEKNKCKRVIGLPGEELRIVSGEIYINGRLLSGVKGIQKDGRDFGPVLIPEDHFFLIGDNMKNSRDSRHFGPVPFSQIKYKALAIFWPVNRINILI